MQFSVLAAGLAVALCAVPGNAAAPRPQVVDPAGDSIGNQGTADVVSATWRTTGDTTTTRVRGRKVTRYTPRKLVATINLAAAPTASPPLEYETSADVAGCGTVRFTYTPGTVGSQILGDGSLWIDCGDETDPTTGDNLLLISGLEVQVGAKSLTWSISLKMLPKHVHVGSKVSAFSAAVHVVEPVFGLDGTTDTGTPLDEGVGDVTWVLR